MRDWFVGQLHHLLRRKRYMWGIDIVSAVIAQTVLLVVILHGRDEGPVVRLLAATAFCSAVLLLVFRAHRQIWTRVALADIVQLVKVAALVAVIVGVASWWEFGPQAPVRVALGSVSVLAAAWIGPRMLARLLWEARNNARGEHGAGTAAEPILLFGSGQRAIGFIKSNLASRRYDILGTFHADERLTGRELLGVPMLGDLSTLGEQLERWRGSEQFPRTLVVTEDGEGPNDLATALEFAAQHALRLSRLPDSSRLLAANGPAEELQQVSIEDILHRETVRLGSPLVPEAIRGKRVLVTGAGGSIGSELVRQVATYDPALIILVEFSEYNLYAIAHEMADSFPAVAHVTELCDVRQENDLRFVFTRHRPQIVLHAAALKHVPLLEDHPDQAVHTNIIGTANVAGLALDYGVEQMTLVSTDKAVNPANVMGCTKRFAEMICQAYDVEAGARGLLTRFSCVRFGNVLGSAGSVVPLFRAQIARGGPVTVTDEDITRYFMTIPEACELILTASASTLTAPGREARVFVLDMGEPVRIVDLASRMIQLHGLRPWVDIDIRITGLRPGEKLHEELAHADEHLVPAPFRGASLAEARTLPLNDLLAAVDRLGVTAGAQDRAAIVSALRTTVPEFIS